MLARINFAILHKLLQRKPYRILAVFAAIALVAVLGYVAVYASPDSETVSDTFDTEEKIASKSNTTVCGGQVKLAEETFTTITECNCNSLDGWYWFTTNGRSACWSKELADTVSWNKGAGSDSDNPGAYTCATDVTSLSDRMRAASSWEWYKIVSDVAGTTITSGHNGQSGASVISALAISDCIDGTRDICTGDGCLGGTVTDINISLAAWASATNNKTALPYCAGSGCNTTANSDYRAACELTLDNDLPLKCSASNIFYRNQKVCNDGDTNYTWAAAVLDTVNPRMLGYSSCSIVSYSGSNSTYVYNGFRAVVRP